MTGQLDLLTINPWLPDLCYLVTIFLITIHYSQFTIHNFQLPFLHLTNKSGIK